MLNPDQIWKMAGPSLWTETVLELADLKITNPKIAVGRAIRKGFKGGVKTANRFFSEELKPENRQN